MGVAVASLSSSAFAGRLVPAAQLHPQQVQTLEFVNRAQRPADDCYRGITLTVGENGPLGASFSLEGRCHGEVPHDPSPFAPVETVILEDGVVATLAISYFGPAIVLFDYSHARDAQGEESRYVLTFYVDGASQLPEEPYKIPDVSSIGQSVVYDSVQ
jgi:hypothetical protein